MANVLIVEDEMIVAADLRATLEELGHSVAGTVDTAESAVASAAEHCPDVVLMDVRIKGDLDGIEAARILRERFDAPIVYLTAHADTATLGRARSTLPSGYLVKPYNRAELSAAVELALYKHEMERRLRQREHWFSTTLRSIGDAVIAVDELARIAFVNVAAEQLVGRRQEDVLGAPIHEVLTLLDEHGVRSSDDPVARAFAAGKSVHLTPGLVLWSADGVARPIEDSVSPITDDAGRRLGAVIVFRDVSERRRLEQQLAMVDRLASLGTLAAGVAHEINNPLQFIMSNLEQIATALRESADGAPPRAPGEIVALITDVITGAERIRDVVADLRNFSASQPDAARVADAARALQWALRVCAKQLEEAGHIETDLGPMPEVVGDERRIAQVFVNLLLNAAQAVRPTRGLVKVVTRTTARGDAAIEVSDTGVGMSEEVRRRIFEPFFTTKPIGQGSGLGLAVSHGIIKALGGDIRVESQTGRGSTFAVRLPAAPATPTAADAPASPIAPAKRLRVLVVDDEPLIAKTLERLLRKHHDVQAMTDPTDAVEALGRGARFDVILCDLMMPAFNGRELYEATLRLDPRQARRIVFLTGGAFAPWASEFLESVPNRRLHKPTNIDELRHVIQDVASSGD